MEAEQPSSGQFETSGKRRRGRLLKTLLFLVIVIGGTAAALCRWVVPAEVRKQVNVAVGQYWDGTTGIGDVDIGYTGGPSYVRDIVLYDAAGRKWARIDSLKLVVEGWPGFKPVLSEIEIDRLLLRGYFENARCTPPFKHPFPEPRETDFVDIKAVTIGEIEIEAASERGRATVLEGVRLEAAEENGSWRISVRRPDDSHGRLNLTGSVDPKARSLTWSLNLRSVFAPEAEARTSELLAALDAPQLHRIWGQLTAELKCQVKLDDPGSWACDGTASLENGALFLKQGPIAEELDFHVKAAGRRIELVQLSAGGLGGQVVAAGYVEFDAGSVVSGGRVVAKDLDLTELARLLPERTRIPSGRANLTYAFAGIGASVADISGRGRLFLDNVDLRRVSPLSGVFFFTGLGDKERPTRSDVEAVFDTHGTMVVIEQGRLASLLAAIDVERGGRIDLATGQMDMYVIGAPFKTAGRLMTHLPLPGADLLAILSQKLMRLRVKGHYSDPKEKLITKEPIKDIQEGTLEFLRYCLSSGGHLSGPFFGPVGSLLRYVQPFRLGPQGPGK